MKLQELIDSGRFEIAVLGEDRDRELTKPFCCDLLSVAMSRASEGCVWVTVMGNINTLAVAALTDTACIILAESAALDEPAKNKAEQQGITVLKTELPIFESAALVAELIKGS